MIIQYIKMRYDRNLDMIRRHMYEVLYMYHIK